MAQVEVKNFDNQVVETLELDDEVFGYSASETLVWEAVRAFQAARRKGTHATKNRSDVQGSGRKLWRQKGTGRARVGNLRSPLWRKGGSVFGPNPRDHSQRFPRRKRRNALKLVLSDRLRQGRLTVVEAFDPETPRTKDLLRALSSLEIEGKVLLVDDGDNRNLYLSSRNLPEVKLSPAHGVNVVDLLHHDQLVMSRQAVLRLQEVLQR